LLTEDSNPVCMTSVPRQRRCFLTSCDLSKKGGRSQKRSTDSTGSTMLGNTTSDEVGKSYTRRFRSVPRAFPGFRLDPGNLLFGESHGLRNEMYIGSRSGSGTCFVAFRACAERRNFSHIESRGNKVSKMAHQAVSCSTVCLLSSRCATRGYCVMWGSQGT